MTQSRQIKISINMEQFQQRAAINSTLLSCIRHKLELAGASVSILGGDAVSVVNGYSEGNPRKIDNLMTDGQIIQSSVIMTVFYSYVL